MLFSTHLQVYQSHIKPQHMQHTILPELSVPCCLVYLTAFMNFYCCYNIFIYTDNKTNLCFMMCSIICYSTVIEQLYNHIWIISMQYHKTSCYKLSLKEVVFLPTLLQHSVSPHSFPSVVRVSYHNVSLAWVANRMGWCACANKQVGEGEGDYCAVCEKEMRLWVKRFGFCHSRCEKKVVTWLKWVYHLSASQVRCEQGYLSLYNYDLLWCHL